MWSSPFDEERYLATYPDVAKAVAAGHFQSGLDHFKRHGLREGRFSVREVSALASRVSDLESQVRALHDLIWGPSAR